MKLPPRAVVSIIFAVLLGSILYIVPAAANGPLHTKAKSGKTGDQSGSNKNSSAKPPLKNNRGRVVSSGVALNLDTSGKGQKPGPNLAPGSNPGVLPTDVLIADRTNSRLLIVTPAGKIVWQFPQPGNLAPGQSFLLPDDAFFTPNGKYIVATEEDDQVISLISIAQHKIIWRYGTPGVPGSTANHVSNPDDAMMLANGDIITADIKNCSILILRPPLHVPIERIGENDPYCYHQPPLRFGSPNGAFPMMNGNYLISEINGDYADQMSLSGKISWITNPPGVLYPSDTNEIAPNKYLTVDYSIPGQIVEFNSSGRLLWRYRPLGGKTALNEPSLCRPIETNGDLLCNDDGNDRVIVVDPKTNKVVWQYGHYHVHGTAPGYLHRPDGVDLAPPYSLTMVHASTMGLPTGHCSVSAPAGTCTFYTASGAASSVPTAISRLGFGMQSSPYADPNAAFGNKASPSGNKASPSGKKAVLKSHLTSFAKTAKHKIGGKKKSTVSRPGVDKRQKNKGVTAARLAVWNLNSGLSREVALQLNAKNVLLAGGFQASGNTTPDILAVNLSSHLVKQVGRLPDPTHDASGALLGGNGYVFGGGNSLSISAVQKLSIGGKSLYTGISGYRHGKSVYKVSASVTGNLPALRSDSTSVTIGQTAYVVGGYSGTAPDGNILSVTKYGKISVAGHLAVPVRYAAVAALGRTIYVFGGQQVVGAQAGQPTSDVQAINLKTGSASVVAHLPTVLMGAQAVTVSQGIIVCGGDEAVSYSGAGARTQSALWLVNTKNWQLQKIGNLAVPVSHAAITTAGSDVWLFGGEKDGFVEPVVQGFSISGNA